MIVNDSFMLQIKALGQLELNTNNDPVVLQMAAQKRKGDFLRALARQYVTSGTGSTCR